MLNKFIIGDFYRPLKFFNSIARLKKNSVTILNYHGIPDKDLNNFRLQIEWLKDNYRIISPIDFHGFLDRTKEISGHAVLITFDDGFISSYNAIKNILDPLGIKVHFFLLSDFVGDNNLDSWESFVRNNIYKICNRGTRAFDYQKPMSNKEIETLIINGHLIGAHTSSHFDLSELSDKKQIEYELLNPKINLENVFGISINSMAYPFGGIEHINERAIKNISKYYTYCYSNIRGDNTLVTMPLAIRRQNITPDMPIPYLGFIIEGGLNLYWVYQRNQLDEFVFSVVE